MIQPLPDSLGRSEHDRLKRFAKALLAVPKAEIMPEETLASLARLEAQKLQIDAKLADVRRTLAKRKS